LTYTTQNILLLGRQSSTFTLVNPVNTIGIMGKGLALALREELGEEYFDAYQEDCRTGRLQIGQLTVWRPWCHFWVLNFPTKQHWRGPSRLEYIEAGLGQFAQAYAFAGITDMVFPKLGCGNGALSWSDIGPLMKRYLDALPIPVIICVKEGDQRFSCQRLPGSALYQEKDIYSIRAKTTREVIVRSTCEEKEIWQRCN
jgi:O-acetyl-ADP-ribose deacetylase (regulator of RNase III)